MTESAVRAWELPHSCETAEVAKQLAGLSPRQRKVLREYVWKVLLGELSVTDWLRSEGCPTCERRWYDAGKRAQFLHNPAFRDAVEEYLVVAQKWVLAQEQRHIERAKSTLVRAAPRAAERLVEQAEADQSAFWHLQYVWVEEPLPSQEILAHRKVPNLLIEGAFVTEYLVARPCLDLNRLRDPKYARLVKKFSDSPKSGVTLEFYDAQRAAESILDRADARTAGKEKITVTGEDGGPVGVRYDLSQLTADQLAELARIAERLAGAADGTQPAPAD